MIPARVDGRHVSCVDTAAHEARACVVLCWSSPACLPVCLIVKEGMAAMDHGSNFRVYTLPFLTAGLWSNLQHCFSTETVEWQAFISPKKSLHLQSPDSTHLAHTKAGFGFGSSPVLELEVCRFSSWYPGTA